MSCLFTNFFKIQLSYSFNFEISNYLMNRVKQDQSKEDHFLTQPKSLTNIKKYLTKSPQPSNSSKNTHSDIKYLIRPTAFSPSPYPIDDSPRSARNRIMGLEAIGVFSKFKKNPIFDKNFAERPYHKQNTIHITDFMRKQQKLQMLRSVEG